MKTQTNITLFNNYPKLGNIATISLLNNDASATENSIVIREPKRLIVNLDSDMLHIDTISITHIDYITFLFDKYYDIPTHEDVRPEMYKGQYSKQFAMKDAKSTRLQIFLFDLVVWATITNVKYIKVILNNEFTEFDANYIEISKQKLSFVTN